MRDIITKASAIDGWMSIGELEWLAQTARTRHTIIEVGSWKGRSTKALAMSTPGVIFAVDHWKGSASEHTGPQKEAVDLGGDRFFEIFQQNLEPEIRGGKVIPVRAESGEAIGLLKILLMGRGGAADMVFIDAEHLYETVVRDIKNYAPLCALGGILSGHDYSTAFPGVMRAVQEFVPGWKTAAESIWYAFKA